MTDVPAALVNHLRPAGRRALGAAIGESWHLDLPADPTAEDVDALMAAHRTHGLLARILGRGLDPALLSRVVPRITSARALTRALECVVEFAPRDQTTLLRRAAALLPRLAGETERYLRDALTEALDVIDLDALMDLESRRPAALDADRLPEAVARALARRIDATAARAILASGQTHPLVGRLVALRILSGDLPGLDETSVPAELVDVDLLDLLPGSGVALPLPLARLAFSAAVVARPAGRRWSVVPAAIEPTLAHLRALEDATLVAALAHVAPRSPLARAAARDEGLAERALGLAPEFLLDNVSDDPAIVPRLVAAILEAARRPGAGAPTTLVRLVSAHPGWVPPDQAIVALGILARSPLSPDRLATVLVDYVTSVPDVPSPLTDAWWEGVAAVLGDHARPILSQVVRRARVPGDERRAQDLWSRYALVPALLASYAIESLMRAVADRLNEYAGDDPHAWSRLAALLPTWTGTLDELLATAGSLAGREGEVPAPVGP